MTLLATNTLTGEPLNWAAAEAFGYPWANYVKADGTAGVSIDILQNGIIEIWIPESDLAQAERLLGKKVSNKPQRVDQLRAYIAQRLGTMIDIPEELLLPPTAV